MPELTAVENVSLPLLIGDGAPLPAADALAALRLFGLETLVDKLPEEMSGGQMQRVALAQSRRGRLVQAVRSAGGPKAGHRAFANAYRARARCTAARPERGLHLRHTGRAQPRGANCRQRR